MTNRREFLTGTGAVAIRLATIFRLIAMIVMVFLSFAVFAVHEAGNPFVADNSNKRNWKIVYGTYEGCERRAVEFASRELGALIQRDAGVNTLHVVPCEKAGCETEKRRNAIVIGTLDSNPLLAACLTSADIPEYGYLVRVVENAGRQLVLCAGSHPAAVIWAVADFMDDGIAALKIRHGDGIGYETEIFQAPRLGSYESRRKPKRRIRSVFSWAHVIGDYEAFFRNLARMRFNEAILWNEYPPLNAREIVDYAHSWGVNVLWGWSWGWSTSCGSFDFARLAELEDEICRSWRKTWKPCGGDGIYFQSFTEGVKADVRGHSVAETVVKLVNAAAGRIWAEDPGLRIVFGLHAEGVQTRLEEISKADPRLEILWENCGSFPFAISSSVDERTTLNRVKSILGLPGRRTGLVYKSQLMQDWSRFAHQSGPYVMGRNAATVIEEDRRMDKSLWREMTSRWLTEGASAWRMTKLIHSYDNAGSLNVVVESMDEPIRLPTALAAEMFWSTDDSWNDLLSRVLKRAWLNAEGR